MKSIIPKLIIGVFILFFSFDYASAFEVQNYTDMPVEGDIVLGPGKSEFILNPGETSSKELKITNRTGGPINIVVEVEDFTGDPNSSTMLLGDEKGPYSLRDYLKPDKNNFILNHGDRAALMVNVEIPNDAEPGGLYGAVIIRGNKVQDPNKPAQNQSQVSISSRLASLFFVKVNGETKLEGTLKTFNADKKFYQNGNVQFSINYENTGRVHLNPYATIDITNLLGKKVDTLEVSPWFVMPGFSRVRTINWGRDLALGRYTATLNLNRGYNDIVDNAKVSFYVVPLKIVIIGFSAIFLLAILIIWLGSKFELKKK